MCILGTRMNAKMHLVDIPMSVHAPWDGLVPKKFFEDSENRVLYFQFIASRLNIRHPGGWYGVRPSDLISHNGKPLLKLFDGGLCDVLCDTYPEHTWQPWRFCHAPALFWEDADNRQCYVDWLVESLQIRKPEDWSQYSAKDLHHNHRATADLWTMFQGSLFKLLSSLYPEYGPWQTWTVSPEFFETPENRVAYLQNIGERLGINNHEEWYKVKKSDFMQLGAEALLSMYDFSVCKLLQGVYSHHSWNEWEFEDQTTTGFWDSLENQRRYMEWLAERLGISSVYDWYKLRTENLHQNKGGPLLTRYGTSISRLVSAIFPLTEWQPFLFVALPRGYHEEVSNQRNYLLWLAGELEMNRMEDWYKLRRRDLVSRNGAKLLEMFNWSVPSLLQAHFPNYRWKPWNFETKPGNYWEDKDHQRRYLEWVAEKLVITKPTDWYKITKGMIHMNEGADLLKIYNESVAQMLSTVYPRYCWLPWLFTKVSSGFWSNSDNFKRFCTWLGHQLEVYCVEDMYHVTTGEITSLGGAYLVHKYGLLGLLEKVYPQFILQFDSNARVAKHQLLLVRQLRKILCSNVDIKSDIKVNVRHPLLLYKNTRPMELDVLVPSLKLAFEYQGEQHFVNHWQSAALQLQQKNDMLKNEKCKQANIMLVQIPFWWDNCPESLSATIRQHRPDLVIVGEGIPIPKEIPQHIRESLLRKVSSQGNPS